MITAIPIRVILKTAAITPKPDRVRLATEVATSSSRLATHVPHTVFARACASIVVDSRPAARVEVQPAADAVQRRLRLLVAGALRLCTDRQEGAVCEVRAACGTGAARART